MAVAIWPILAKVASYLGVAGLAAAAKPVTNVVSQQVYNVLPNELIDTINLINLRHRGLIGETYYLEEMKKGGFDDIKASLLYQGAESILAAYDVIGVWRREGITQEKRDVELKALGFTPERIGQLVKITEAIPNARDIIAFAVREVYSPEIAAQFGQYEGADQVYNAATKDLQAVGMSKETFTKYWAAHWQLPSMTQGYEMLHRKVIESEDLDRLMVAMDVMPWWRDKLKAISFNPYTRVDVRRMHKIGVLSDDELEEAYEAVGYNPEMAARMAKFTIIYNFGPEASEMTAEDRMREEQRGASRAAIMKGYKGNLLERVEVLTYLDEIGYSPEAAELYVATADLDLEEEITDKKIDTIHDLYVRRLIERSEAISRLGVLNLPAKQSDALLANWDVEKDARTNRPSKSELFKLFKLRIISESQLRDELEGHGYPEKVIKWYLAMQKAG